MNKNHDEWTWPAVELLLFRLLNTDARFATPWISIIVVLLNAKLKSAQFNLNFFKIYSCFVTRWIFFKCFSQKRAVIVYIMGEMKRISDFNFGWKLIYLSDNMPSKFCHPHPLHNHADCSLLSERYCLYNAFNQFLKPRYRSSTSRSVHRLHLYNETRVLFNYRRNREIDTQRLQNTKKQK